MMIGYKLMHLRKDGSLGPLFINRPQRVPLNEWLRAGSHPKKGFAVRPGWHCTQTPHAPHLSTAGRVWCRVSLKGVKLHDRPKAQGGVWMVAQWMRVEEML